MFFLINLIDLLTPKAFNVTPAYDAASHHLSTKGIRTEEIIVFIIFGIIAVIFIIFLILVYFKERNKPRY